MSFCVFQFDKILTYYINNGKSQAHFMEVFIKCASIMRARGNTN